MNRIPGRGFAARWQCALIYATCAYGLFMDPAAADADPERVYDVEYTVIPERERSGARVKMRLRQENGLLRQLNMRAEPDRISEVGGDGEFQTDGGRLSWTPPSVGGELRWFAKINNRRGASFDAMITDQWALFRGEDIIPSATTRTLKGASSRTTLRFELPPGWSSTTQYGGENDRYVTDNPERRFDTPTGWIVLGEQGIRTETIAGVRVKVAAPTGQDVRRMDMLALLQWNLPPLARILPDFPSRLTIVSAGDPMWRGGLSAPMSIYLHAERPLLSENATSTLLHEVVHVGLGKSAAEGADWVVEGLAEFYSLQILRRSGTISERRFERALEMQSRWSEESTTLCGSASSGAETALAVALMAELDQEILATTDGQKNLDDVIQVLANSRGKITIQSFIDAATDVNGEAPGALDSDRLPGCDT